MAKTPIIEVRGLSARFGERRVLNDVNFTAYENEITVILGSSGGGKTTVLKHVIGLYPIAKGSVHVAGHRLESIGERERYEFFQKIGVFYQQGALLNSLTVAENVALPLEQHSDLTPEIIDAIVWAKLDLMNLENAYDLYPSQLSGGMLKRAALARAIVMDPPLLFCDEPAAGLDPNLVSSMNRHLRKMKRHMGMTIVIVSHQPAIIFRLADRIIFLDGGRVVFEGSLDAALTSDVAPVKRFFGVARRHGTLIGSSQ